MAAVVPSSYVLVKESATETVKNDNGEEETTGDCLEEAVNDVKVGAGEERKDQEKAMKKCTVKYRTLALIFTLSFYFAFGIGAILTLTVTKYSPDVDYIYRVYETFNPCIFMDHYPANLASSVGIIGMTIGNILCMTFLFIHTMLTQSDLAVMIKWFLLFAPLFFLYAAFINIFSDNLYEYGYTKAPDYSGLNATEYAKATANMTSDEIDGISEEVWEVVASHSSWFAFYLFADIAYNVLYWQHMVRLGNTKYFPKPKGWRGHWAYKKVGKWIICFLYFYSFFIFFINVSVIVFAHNGKDRGHATKKNISYVQGVFNFLAKATQPQLWFSLVWLGIIPSQFIMPPEVGLHFEFRLENDDESKKGTSILQNGKWITKHIYPANIISGAFKVLCCLMILTYSFKQTDANGTKSILPLASGFKEKPFRYIFAPSWVVLTGIVGFGTYLISIRETLSHRKSPIRVTIMQIIAVLYVLMMLLGVWVIIPNTKIGEYMVVTAYIIFPIWVGLVYGELHQTKNERIRLGLFFMLYIAFAATSPLHPVLNTLLLILMALFDRIVPEYEGSDGLTMTVCPVTFGG